MSIQSIAQSSLVAVSARVRTRRAAAAGVWATFALVVVLAGWGADLGAVATETPQASAVAGPTVAQAAGEVAISPDFHKAATDNARDYNNDPTSILPAWRWNGISYLTQNYGAFDLIGGSAGFSLLANALFLFGGACWAIILLLIKWSMTMDLATAAAQPLNRGFHVIANSIGSSALFGMIIVVATFTIVRMAFSPRKGQGPAAAFSSAVVAILALGSLLVLGDNTAPTVGCTPSATQSCQDDQTPNGLTVGTPAWIAVTGDRFVGEIAATLSSGFGTLANENTVLIGGGNDAAPNCQAYSLALYDQYKAYGNRLTDANDPNSVKVNGASQTAMITVSQLWQRSYQVPWELAQFGWSNGIGQRIGCHRFEQNASVSAHEAAITHELAYPDINHGRGNAPEAPGNGWNLEPDLIEKDPKKLREANEDPGKANDYSTVAKPRTWDPWDIDEIDATAPAADLAYTRIFSPNLAGEDNGDNVRRNVFAWAACAADGDGNWKATPAFQDMWNDEMFNAEACKKWWNNGVFRDENATDQSKDPFDLSSSETSSYPAAHELWEALNGHNVPQRLLLSAVTLATAIVYLAGLGSMAVGCIIAIIGLYVLLTCSPLALLLMAPPSTRIIGIRILKVTGTFMLSKFILALGLGMILYVTVTLDKFIR